jgi:hypothetical protein
MAAKKQTYKHIQPTTERRCVEALLLVRRVRRNLPVFSLSVSIVPLFLFLFACLGFIMSLCSVLQPQQASPFHRVPALAERMRCGFLLWYWYYRTLSFQRHD